MNTIVATAVCLLAVTLGAATPATAYGTGSWIQGRATFFGRDAWSLHTGSCGFGFCCPNRWSNELVSGWDLTAISDKNPLWNGMQGSQCGQCLEVQCQSKVVTDATGAVMDRTGLCKDESTSVKVKITDTCACNYAPNAASNSRWCCGDQPHLDVSQWALDKLVKDSNTWGVFGIKYRTIDCSASIANPAPAIPMAADPHAGEKGNTDCGSQGVAAPTQSLSSGSQNRQVSSTPSKYDWRSWLHQAALARRQQYFAKSTSAGRKLAL